MDIYVSIRVHRSSSFYYSTLNPRHSTNNNQPGKRSTSVTSSEYVSGSSLFQAYFQLLSASIHLLTTSTFWEYEHANGACQHAQPHRPPSIQACHISASHWLDDLMLSTSANYVRANAGEESVFNSETCERTCHITDWPEQHTLLNDFLPT